MAVLWLQTVPSRVSTVPNWGHCKTMPNTQSPFKHSPQLYQTCLSSPWPAFSHGRLRGQWKGPQHHLWSPYLHMTKSILPGLLTPPPLHPLTKNEPYTRETFPPLLLFRRLWYLMCCSRAGTWCLRSSFASLVDWVTRQRIKCGPPVASLGTMEHVT